MTNTPVPPHALLEIHIERGPMLARALVAFVGVAIIELGLAHKSFSTAFVLLSHVGAASGLLLGGVGVRKALDRRPTLVIGADGVRRLGVARYRMYTWPNVGTLPIQAVNGSPERTEVRFLLGTQVDRVVGRASVDGDAVGWAEADALVKQWKAGSHRRA